MRQTLSIAKATALEILSEPLTLLVLLAALALTVLTPAFHYHQFGEATRMARDAGLSALFTCGSVVAAFGTIRAFRREVESGTLAMALAHPISREGFFLAKTLGALVAYLAFALIVLGATFVIFEGAAIGGIIAKRSGDIARLYGPHLAGGIAILLLPLVIAAALNRFGRFRFVLSSILLALALAAVGGGFVAYRSYGRVLRLVPVAVLIAIPATVLLSAAAAFAMRWKANAAAAATGIVFALTVPAIGNYYLADALSGGGAVTWAYVGWATLAALPAEAALLLLGTDFARRCDIS